MSLLCDYFHRWMEIVKKPIVSQITYNKYISAFENIKKYAPELKVEEMDRYAYQKLINNYGADHSKTTVADFHHILKACILDAMDDGLVSVDPTRRVVLGGQRPPQRKKCLSATELSSVMQNLQTEQGKVSEDWLLVLVAMTGMRFAEALAITPEDFDFKALTVRVSKTWDYKHGKQFAPTKNESSVRTIDIDWRTRYQFEELCEGLKKDEPIFIQKGCSVFNSTYNARLHRACEKAGVPKIGVHGLRHTHASILLASGTSIASISKRLGHANMNTTQSVYLHITEELQNKDKKNIAATMIAI